MTRRPPVVIGIAAPSGTGKTTLLKQLIPLLRQRGLRVGVIKRTHHDVEVDRPGKDSHTLRRAGASPVMLSSPLRRVVISEHAERREPALEDDLAGFPRDQADLILVEGARSAAIPKIELHRPDLGLAPLFPGDSCVIAVATDDPGFDSGGLPRLDLNLPQAVADFLLDYLARRDAP